MAAVALKVLNYQGWDVFKGKDSNDELYFFYAPLGDLVLSYVQYLVLPEDVTFLDLVREEIEDITFLDLVANIVLETTTSIFLPRWQWTIKSIYTGVVLATIIADVVFLEEVFDDVIKTKNIPISGQIVVDVGTQLDIRRNGEIWLWRGVIDVTAFEPSRVDVSFDNPNRFYFGLCTISYFGNTLPPQWIRTDNAFISIHQVTPDYAGKAVSGNVNYPNLLYPYPRGDRVIFDLRPSVLGTLKLTACKILSDLENWW